MIDERKEPVECADFRVSYERDDEKYEYVERRHMIIYPSEKAGWEQILRHDGMVGKPSFYVWRRPRGWRESSPIRLAEGAEVVPQTNKVDEPG